MSGTVLLTGGSGGLGLSVARALAGAGYGLVLVGRRDEPLRAAARELGARAIPWNVSRDPEALIAIAAPVDHLVHCASARPETPVEGWTAEDFRRAQDLFVTGPALLSRAFAAEAPERQDRAVVFVSPALSPERGYTPWYAARAAAVALAVSLGAELGLRCEGVLGAEDPGAEVLRILRAQESG